MWIPDTINADGIKWLSAPNQCPSPGGKDMVLLLVYPIVGGDGSAAGGKEGGFTRDLMKAYRGDTVAVVGTQNRNGYTGFKTETMDEFMERDEWRKKEGWRKVVQVPLPSFAGKDEALFIFQRGKEALEGGGGGAKEGNEGGEEQGSGKAKKKKKKSSSGKKKKNKGGESKDGVEEGENGKVEGEGMEGEEHEA